MKVILAAFVCALAVKTVMVMPVAEPGSSDPLPVVPLEKSSVQHVLRRETVETAPVVTEHKENETPEAHKAHEAHEAHDASHQHQQARLADKPEALPEKLEKKEEKKEEAKPTEEKIITEEKKAELPEKKEEQLKTLATEAVAESIAPVEAPAPISASVPAAPVESKVNYNFYLNI